MLFTVTYRVRDGALREECVEAASRSECVSECRRRGIAPTGIREGSTGRDKRGLSRVGMGDNKRTTARWVAVAVVSVIAIAGGVWWRVGRRGATAIPTKDKMPVSIETRKKRVAPTAVSAKQPTQSETPSAQPTKAVLPEWNDSFLKDPQRRLQYSTLFQATTNNGGLVIERYRLPNGKTWRRIVEPPPIFDNISDQAIAMVMASRAGAPIPPVPGLDDANLNEEFVKSLTSPIHVEENDSPRTAALKIAVKEVREEIARLLKEGDTRTVGQILRDHMTANNHNVEMQTEALAAAKKIRETDGEAAAEEYLKAVNEQLKSYGIHPIRLGGVDPRKKVSNEKEGE